MNKEEIEKIVTNPPHYAGVTIEPLDVVQCYGFLMGNAIKYLVRAGKKEGSSEESDLRKAKFYLERWSSAYQGERANLAVTPIEDKVDALRHLAAGIWLLSERSVYLRVLFALDDPDSEAALPNQITLAAVEDAIETIDLNLGEE